MKQSSPAALRNRDPIAALLARWLPATGTVLEVASGSGEHVVHFAARFPALRWQPSDPQPDAISSVEAYAADAGLLNLQEPITLDAAAETWPVGCADAILCINMVHISPWAATIGLMRGAGRLLPAGGPLILYGPYRRAGVPTAPSNEAFDASLQARDPAWGLRDLETVAKIAGEHGLTLKEIVEMPANNLSLLFQAAA